LALYGIIINNPTVVISSGKDGIEKHPDDIDNIYKLVASTVLVITWFKLSWFCKMNKSLGLMTQLLLGVLGAVIPFLVIYFIWVFLFALVAKVLGANRGNAQGYSGVDTFLGHFFVAFENSIG
jgi:hypothetical protein